MANQETRTVASLIEQLQSDDRAERLFAARQLADFDEKAKACIPILKKWIGGEDRYAHVAALGTIIGIDKTEADALLPLLIPHMKTFKELLMADTVNLLEVALFDSLSLFNEMAVLNPNAISKTQTAMQFIHNNNIPGVIIGGIAVANYTQDRALTPDVDFLTPNIDGLKTLLQQQGIPFQPLASSGEFGGIYVPSLDADFLDVSEGNIGLNQYIVKTATTAKIGGVAFPIIDAAVLTIMKFIIGRDKDQTDAFKLLPTIPKANLKVHLKALSRYLPEDTDADTIWSYAQAMSPG
jgi:hypothetical protein